MESIIAKKYHARFEALPLDKKSERLWELPGFEATISYNPGPARHREMILTFVADGSVFDYYDRLAYSRTEWADRNKSTVWP